ncbi:hypothetical protein [Thermosulfuriphilus sp.]
MKVGLFTPKEGFIPSIWGQIERSAPSLKKILKDFKKPPPPPKTLPLYQPRPSKKGFKLVSLDLSTFWQKVEIAQGQFNQVMGLHSGASDKVASKVLSQTSFEMDLDLELEFSLELDPEKGLGSIHFELSLSREVAYKGLVAEMATDSQKLAKVAYFRQEELEIDLDLTFALEGKLRPLPGQRALDTGRYFISWARENIIGIYDRLSGLSTSLEAGPVDQILYTAFDLADDTQVVVQQGPEGIKRLIVSRDMELSYISQKETNFSDPKPLENHWESLLKRIKALGKELS